jgi:hypothetical protein
VSRGAAALATACMAGLAGCSTLISYAPKPPPDEGEWARVRDEATRRFELYDGFIHRATATATYLDERTREARAKRLALWFSWTDEELAARRALEAAEAAKYEEFVVVFYTAEKDENDLDAPRSVWRLAVENDGLEALAVDRSALDIDLTLRGLYPWIGPFDVVYRIRFPKGSEPLTGKPFVLLLASASGKIPLDWSVPAVKFHVPKAGP